MAIKKVTKVPKDKVGKAVQKEVDKGAYRIEAQPNPDSDDKWMLIVYS